MIITTSGGTVFNVGVKESFNYTWIRAIEFYNTFNGSQQSSDRGLSVDRHESAFTVIGDIADIELLAETLRYETKQITLQMDDEPIFGVAIDYSVPIVCNMLSKISYPIRDVKTATLPIKVRALNAIYNATIPSAKPELFYQFPVSRKAELNTVAFDSPIIGDYGIVTLVDDTGNPLAKESAQVKVINKTPIIAQLQKFLSVQRGDSFSLTTANMELFLGATTSDVICTEINMTRQNVNFWEASLTLVKV